MSFSGIARDLLIPALILFAVFAVLVAFTDLSTAVQHVFVQAGITPKGSVVYNQTETLVHTYRVFNYALPLLFTGMLTAAIILASRLGAPPIGYFIGLIALFFVVLPISFLLSNIMGTTFANPAWVQYANQYPLVAYIFAYLPYYIAAGGIIYLMASVIQLRRNPYVGGGPGNAPSAEG